MNQPNMDPCLLALRSGRMSFQTFELRTRNVWVATAEHILRRWKGPVAVSVEDVKQELLIYVWTFVGHWDPSLGISIGRYVMFNAYDKAKKWLHQQRNAYRRDDKSSARFDLPVSSLNLTEHAEEHFFDAIATSPTAEDMLAGRQFLLRAVATAPVEYVPAVVALAKTGDFDLAVEALYSNPLLALAGVATMNDARQLVADALNAVA
jgi:hypothetical protein